MSSNKSPHRFRAPFLSAMNANTTSEVEDAILQVASKPAGGLGLPVIRSPPHEHGTVRTSITEPFDASPTCLLGGLECLPVEILSEIILHLDIKSCFNFRTVNRFSREVVSSIQEYRIISSHAIEALRAVLRTGLAPKMTLSQLFRPLCTKECAFCGRFGNFIFLLTAKRYCYHCYLKGDFPSRPLMAATLDNLSEFTGISCNQLLRLVPVVHTIPGNYGFEKINNTNRRYYVSPSSALDDLRHLGFEVPEDNAPLLHKSTYIGLLSSSTDFPYFDRATRQSDSPIDCIGCQVGHSRGLIPANGPSGDSRRWWSFTKEGFLAHFKCCSYAQQLWAASGSGTVDIKNWNWDFLRRLPDIAPMDSNGNPK